MRKIDAHAAVTSEVDAVTAGGPPLRMRRFRILPARSEQPGVLQTAERRIDRAVREPRRVHDLEPVPVSAGDRLEDQGFQVQASGMVIDQTLQAYVTYAKINGEYGDPDDFRVGLNWFPWKNHVVRWNLEYINTTRIPVGGLSLPYPVGGTGYIVHSNFQVNF